MADDRLAGDAWVTRVLGVPVIARPTASAIWHDAKSDLDQQISVLAGLVAKDPHPWARALSEKGLYGFTPGVFVPLAAAAMEFDRADPMKRSASGQKLLKAVAALRAYAEAHDVVRLLDANPFGVRLAMRSSLVRAADRLAATVGA